MTAHIEIVSTASRLGSDVRQFISNLQRVVDDVDKIKAISDQVALYQALNALPGSMVADDTRDALHALVSSIQ